MKKSEWILMAVANQNLAETEFIREILHRIERFADLLEEKKYFDPE